MTGGWLYFYDQIWRNGILYALGVTQQLAAARLRVIREGLIDGYLQNVMASKDWFTAS